MKSSWVLYVVVALLFSGIGAANGAEPEGAVTRQELSVTLQPERHALIGESNVAFAPGIRRANFRLNSDARIDSVLVGGREVSFSFDGGVLSLALPEHGPTLVTVSYRTRFNDPVSRHPAASEDPSYGVSAAVTRGGTFLGGGAYWYPVPEWVPATRQVAIAAPAGIEGVTFGARLSRSTAGGVTRSVWREARPVGVLSLSAGPYLVEEREAAGVKLYSYFYRENAKLAPRYLDAAAKYLSLYRDLLGPYPFEKFAVVENFFPTGYGFPSYTLLGGSVIRLPFIVDTSLPHEIVHSWFGNGVDVDPGHGNWSEGLTSYLADYLLKERLSPAEAVQHRRQLLIDYASLVNPQNDFPISEFVSRSDPSSRAIGYGKGAMLFHMIRKEIGDQAFFAALRSFTRERMYASASWSDLVAAFSRSSGRNVASSFETWLNRPGGARLSLADVETKSEGNGWLVTGEIRQESPRFPLEVPLHLETAAGAIKKVVSVGAGGGGTRFSISTSSIPKRLLLDPEADTFRILSPAEIPATVNSLKGSRNLVGVVTRNCLAQAGTFKSFLASLSQGAAPVIDETQLGQAELDRDLLFCGAPERGGVLPSAPEEISLLRPAPPVASGQEDYLRLLVLKRQAPGKGVVGVFQPLSEQAARQYAPKITHYGKYGRLVFYGGGVKEKGVPAVSDAATAVDLRPPKL